MRSTKLTRRGEADGEPATASWIAQGIGPETRVKAFIKPRSPPHPFLPKRS
jgi:hypothetical protein